MKETVEAAWVATIEERIADLERCISALEKNREADQQEIADLRQLHELRERLRLGVCGDYTLFTNGNSLDVVVLDDGIPIVRFRRQSQLTQEQHKLTKAHYNAEVLSCGRRAHIVDSAQELGNYEEKIVKNLKIGEEGRPVDVRQFVSAVSWAVRGKIQRGHEAEFAGIVMPDSVDDAILIVVDIRRSPEF